MNLAERIKEERQKAGLSQKDLGDKAGMSPAMVGHYETGYRRPKFHTLERIADALNLPIEVFLDSPDRDASDVFADEFSPGSIDFVRKLRSIGWRVVWESEGMWMLSSENGERFSASTDELERIEEETDSFLRYKLCELHSKKKGG